MHFLQTLVVAALATAAAATYGKPGSNGWDWQNKDKYWPHQGKVIEVKLVAQDGKVQYIPDRVDADPGDVIKFRFFAQAHSATQSSFKEPCTALPGGFDSDLIPNPDNKEGREFERLFYVKDKEPKWFYCKQPNKNHCGQGMVFGINPAGKMDEFIQRAKDQNGALVNQPPPPSPTASTPPPPPPSPPADNTAPQYTVVVSGGFNPDGSNSLKFDPPFLHSVKKGEKVAFDFRKLNHTLTESTFDKPCTKKPYTDIDTNFQNVNVNDVPGQNVTVVEFHSEESRFFYCRQANGTPKGHCSNGMVFGVNIDDQTFIKFQNNAKATLPKIKGRSPVVLEA